MPSPTVRRRRPEDMPWTGRATSSSRPSSADLTDGTRIVDEEQFGPALPVISYRDVDEVVERANATHFGLSGSVWGADGDRAAEVAGRLECGTAWVNTHLGARAPTAVRGIQVEWHWASRTGRGAWPSSPRCRPCTGRGLRSIPRLRPTVRKPPHLRRY